MATKLKGLEVGKVDFVDEGANQRADIKLLKGKNKAEETSDPEIGLFKRFLNWISGEVQKSATTFDEQINAVSMDAIRDEIWSVCYALQNSLNSILCDPELDSSGKAFNKISKRCKIYSNNQREAWRFLKEGVHRISGWL